MHVEVNICMRIRVYLATEYCPHVETVVMIDKTVAQAAWPEGARLRIANYVAANEQGAISADGVLHRFIRKRMQLPVLSSVQNSRRIISFPK